MIKLKNLLSIINYCVKYILFNKLWVNLFKSIFLLILKHFSGKNLKNQLKKIKLNYKSILPLK